MWLKTSFSKDRIVGSFAEFLGSPAYLAHVRDEGRAPSLADALGDWIERGEGLNVCPDHGSFLAATLLVIDEWLTSDRKRIIDAPLYPADPDAAIELFSPLDADSNDTALAEHHPILQRVYFEMLQCERTARRDVELRDQLSQLTERLET